MELKMDMYRLIPLNNIDPLFKKWFIEFKQFLPGWCGLYILEDCYICTGGSVFHSSLGFLLCLPVWLQAQGNSIRHSAWLYSHLPRLRSSTVNPHRGGCAWWVSLLSCLSCNMQQGSEHVMVSSRRHMDQSLTFSCMLWKGYPARSAIAFTFKGYTWEHTRGWCSGEEL